MTGWTVEYDGDEFARFFRSLSEYEQAVLAAAIDNVLKVHGIDVCAGEWGKPLGQGLYEFRVRRSLKAILSAAGLDHTAFPGTDRSVRDPSAKRQQKERNCSEAARGLETAAALTSYVVKHIVDA